MARKIMVQQGSEARNVLMTETSADDEFQLQEIMKENPDLLPVDEFGINGQLMVVGRETTLPSGAVDLLGIGRGGELLLIEFKTGPQNADFRHVLAQLVDYGSDLWQMSYAEFESTVVSRYFSSDHCQDARVRGKTSLDEAAREIWPELSDEEALLFREHLTERLAAGAFYYVVVAQRFTPTMERTTEYLNAAMSEARFYAVELVRFVADELSAFESRTVLKPLQQSPSPAREAMDEIRFLEQIEDETYRLALQEFLDVCRGLGLQVGRGKRGLTIRLSTHDRKEPLSIAWLFPPNVSGWMGLLDLTLGFDLASAQHTPSVASALEDYVAKVEALPDVEPAKPDWLRGYYLKPATTIQHRHQVADVLAELVRQVSEELG